MSSSRAAGKFLTGIQVRLTAAFSVVAVVAVGAAVIAWISVDRSESRVEEIVKKTLPTVSSAQALSQAAGVFAALAQGLIWVENETERVILTRELNIHLVRMENEISHLENLDFEPDKLEWLKTKISRLAKNFHIQSELAAGFIKANRRLRAAVKSFRTKHRDFVETAQPRIKTGYRDFLERGEAIQEDIRKALADLAENGQSSDLKKLDDEIRIGLGTIINMEAGEMRANLELVAVTHLAAGLLHEAAEADDMDQVRRLEKVYQERLKTIQRLKLILSTSTPENRLVLIKAFPLLAFGRGEDSIFKLRIAELKARAVASVLASSNKRLSEDLTSTLQSLVAEAKSAANNSSSKLNYILARAKYIQAMTAILAVTITLFIGWIYVGKRVISRILNLRRAMEAQAAGENVPIPDQGRDEIGDMARALGVFIEQRRKAEIDLKNAKDQAEAANEAKGRFLANMSHELRTPLNAILGFTNLLRRSPGLGEKDRESLRIIIRNGEHLLSLINQVLDLSKIEAGKATLEEKSLDLHQMLIELEETFTLKTTQKNLTLSFERSEDVPRRIVGDELKLRQILINLLNNALSYTDQGGVSVRADRSGDRLVFTVADTGRGVPADEMEKIFEPFEQTSSSLRTREGTGLGMSITRNFVEMMGGRIRVDSEPGRGTRFRFDLRLKEAEDQPPPPHQSERIITGIEATPAGRRVLIVDDTPDSRTLLVDILAPLGFETREAENGREAVDVWRDWRPDLVLMDLRMPEMDGYEAARLIRDHPSGGDTVIIALSASSLEQEHETALTNGCDDFLAKPLHENQLLAIIEKHTGLRFTYEADRSVHRATGSTGRKLSPDRLKSLPREMAARLKQAASNAEMDDMETIISEIKALDPVLSQALAELAYDFEYGKILAALGRAEDEGHDRT